MNVWVVTVRHMPTKTVIVEDVFDNLEGAEKRIEMIKENWPDYNAFMNEFEVRTK